MKPAEPENFQEGFFSRHRLKLIVAGVVLGGGGVLFLLGRGTDTTTRATERPATQIVNIVLPPPPPPPPPPPREPRPETMREAREMIVQESIPEADDSTPDEAPPANDAPLGTGITGNGPADGFGLGTGPGDGRLFGGQSGRSGGTGSVWARYGNRVQADIQNALSMNPETRALEFESRLRVWVDDAGRIERVELGSGTASPAILASVRSVLLGLPIQQTAPADLPMPVVLQLRARRPN